MKTINDFIQSLTGLSSAVQNKLLGSLIIILILWLLRLVIKRIIVKRTEDIKSRYMWGKAISYTILVLAIILLGGIWIKGFRTIGTFIGLFSAGLAIALKDLISNLAGWLFIILRKPFGLGDRIQIGDHSGDVIDIRAFQFTIMEIGNWVDADQSTGRIVHISNGKVFTDSLANFSRGFQ